LLTIFVKHGSASAVFATMCLAGVILYRKMGRKAGSPRWALW